MSKFTKILLCTIAILVVMNIGIFIKNVNHVAFAIVYEEFKPITADGIEGCVKHNLSWRLVKNATCTTDGKEEQFCKICKKVTSTRILPKSHKFNEATCTMPKECRICGLLAENALGHDFSIAATCALPKKCSRCGEYTGEPLGHKAIKQAKCGEYEICERCGIKRGPIDHEFSFIIIDSTWHQEICNKCNYMKTMQRHDYENNVCKDCTFVKNVECTHLYEWKVTEEATCEEAGEEAYKCKYCEKIDKTRKLAKQGHKNNWIITQIATCKEKGVESYKCEKCGNISKTRDITKLPHSFYYKSINSLNHKVFCETCDYNKTGAHIYVGDNCRFCEFVKNTETNIDNNITPEQKICKHSYRWVTTIPATCEKNGSVAYICYKCNSIDKIKETPKKAHKYTIKATCMTAKTCSVCGETTGKALGHQMKYEQIANDAINHRLICKRSGCNYEDNGPHIFVNNKCKFCKLKKPNEDIIEVETSQGTIGKNCEHVYSNATCTKPAMCQKCKKQYGSPLGHMLDASNKYCMICGEEVIKENKSLHQFDESKIKYSKISNDTYAEKHIEKVKCIKCNSEITRKENHTFNEKGKCACGTEYKFKIYIEGLINNNKIEMKPGTKAQIKLEDNSNTLIRFNYSSSDKTGGISVDSNGFINVKNDVIKGKSATINVKSQYGKSQQINVAVIDKEKNRIIIIQEGDKNGSAYKMQPITLKAQIEGDEKYTEIAKTVNWRTANNSGKFNTKIGETIVFTPTQSGIINIYASAKINGKNEESKISINVKNIDTIKLTEKMTIMIDDMKILNNVKSLEIISGKDYLDVQGNMIIAKKVGTCTLRDEKNNIYTVNVVEQLINISSIEIILDKEALFVGEEQNVQIKVTPEDANEEYKVTVNSGLEYNDGVIKALTIGDKTLTVISKNAKKSTKIKVIKESLGIKDEKIVIDVNDKTYKISVDTTKLRNGENSKLTYKSENTKIFDVKQDGTIVPKYPGEAKVIVSTEAQEYKNGKLQSKIIETSKNVKITGKVYTSLNDAVFLKEGTKDESKEVLIFIPGAGGLNWAGNEGKEGKPKEDLKENGDCYYTCENGNKYNNDVLTYTKGKGAAGCSKFIEEAIFKQYGVSSVEEFNQKGYTLTVAGFSNGGAIAITMASELVELGFNIETLALFDCSITGITTDQWNDDNVTGKELVENLVVNEGLNLIAVSSDEMHYDSAARETKRLGEYIEGLADENSGTVQIIETKGTKHETLLHSEEGVELLDSLAGGINETCSSQKIVSGHKTTIQKYDIFEKDHKITYYCNTCQKTFTKPEFHTFVNKKCKCGKENNTAYIYANGVGKNSVKENDGGVIADKGKNIDVQAVKNAIKENEQIDFTLFSAGSMNLDAVVDSYTDVMQNGNEPKEITIRLVEPALWYCGGNKSDASGLVQILEDIPDNLKSYVKIELVVGEEHRNDNESAYEGTIKTYTALTDIQNDNNKANFAGVELYGVNQTQVSDGENTYDCTNIEYEAKNNNSHEAAQEAVVNTFNIGVLS
ncbi:MAG: hypothetical protein J6C46_06645 [Clostridia bacterium]|nr:hypothetical protein [Clostridia bacterium]